MQRIQNSRLRLSILGCLTIASLTFNSTATAACVDTNTCYGTDALASNTDGVANSAFGNAALASNTTGYANTASGFHTLFFNATGSLNTASGYATLDYNTSSLNTASGAYALFRNGTGSANTASGVDALTENTTGSYNTASGFEALANNGTGINNTASGAYALNSNTTGRNNTVDGSYALYSGTGSRNVALGYYAGYDITTGSDNIAIGSGQKGLADDNGVMRLGNKTRQTKTFIAGIRGVTSDLANAVPVLIDARGQLGTVSSSRRFKEDIQPMGGVSERLFALRPVTFRYKKPYEDGSKPVQFGLVAEEVAQVFPELAVTGEDGQPETVRYDLLATLLVNELQKQHQVTQDQVARIEVLEKQAQELAELRAQVATMAKVIERLQ